MHPSYFMILDSMDEQSQIELTLSAEASEWLFHIKFWEELSKKYQTDFAQYEEEVIAENMTADALTSLKYLADTLTKNEGKELSFRYAWNENKEEIICRIGIQIIGDELRKLIQIFDKAAKCKLEVYCQL